MKISLINGSPIKEKSTSGYLMEQLKAKLDESFEILDYRWDSVPGNPILSSDAVVFACPLYFDSLPSNFLAFLEGLDTGATYPDLQTKVYIILNNAFFEPDNNRYAVNIISNWCLRLKLWFGGALCVGAGPLSEIAPIGTGPMKNLGSGLDAFANAINKGRQLPADLYIEPDFPLEDYLKNANDNWLKSAKKRGLTESDLRSKSIV